MDNKQIVDQIKLYASILELHGENTFKIRSYHNAVFTIDKMDKPLASLSLQELEKLQGIGKAIAAKIDDANRNGMFRQLKEALETIPAGVVDMLGISGLGVKKIRVLWQEVGIEDTEQLLQACENNQIAEIKGFGAKTQENILQILLFQQANSDKVHYAGAEKYALELKNYLQTQGFEKTAIVGEVRRRLEIVNLLQLVVGTSDIDDIVISLDACPLLEKDAQACGVFAWRGTIREEKLKVEVRITSEEKYFSEIFLHSASNKHLGYMAEGATQTLLQIAQTHDFSTEEAIFEKVNLPFIEPELREGMFEFELAQNNQLPTLIELKDIRGILHAHSTYSDGKNTLEVMAQSCKELGYEYLGITDHSKSAFYANGLYEYQVENQQKEIDSLNQKLSPFKIFKGIESDILNDGSLDYEKDILNTFDFVIASVHSVLKMDENKATNRLIKAIENPYTTILGHPTGRVLLRREGYPIDYQKVIDACAANGVVIEVNASPWRLDLDWRWVHQAIEKGVLLSVNPDSHAKNTIQDTYYGICVGRKGGLTKEMTLNTKGLEDITVFFQSKKP